VDRSFFRDLTTKRLFLRAITSADTDLFFQEFSDPVVNEFIFDAEPCRSLDDARKWIDWYTNDVPDHHRWVLVSKETGLRLGTCGFHKWDSSNNSTELGFEMLPEYWGKGYMAEAVTEALGFAFYIMKIRRVYATTYVANLRSQRLLEKLGFNQEGRLKDYFFFHGKYYDQFLYSLIKGEAEH
jgi:[ribosomal protein S5]-alanine N-acetyltransferase